jgi:hypothetical protein
LAAGVSVAAVVVAAGLATLTTHQDAPTAAPPPIAPLAPPPIAPSVPPSAAPAPRVDADLARLRAERAALRERRTELENSAPGGSEREDQLRALARRDADLAREIERLEALERVSEPPARNGEPPFAPLVGRRAADVVDLSAFGPTRVEAGAQALVQLFLHRPEDRERAARDATEADPGAGARGRKPLDIELERGARVELVLDGGGLDVDEPRQSLVWRGDPIACQFLVAAPADHDARRVFLKATVVRDGIPVGRLAFALDIGAAEATKLRVLDGEPKRYRKAFLSYASSDRAEVLKRAQGLKAARIDFFQDVLNIEPGERWEKRLYLEIDSCDLFLLFWSRAASASEWVRREAEYALAREEQPDITPIVLEGPPPPTPPQSLAGIHFGDPLAYAIAAESVAARART